MAMAEIKKPLAGRVALVTGSAKRLGRSLALALGARGAAVAVHYLHSEAEAREVVMALRATGADAETFRADVTDPGACEALVASVVRRFGALHVLINNVGDYLEKSVLDVSPAEWRHMLGSNLDSTFYMTRAALPALRQQAQGRVINIGFAGSEHLGAHVNQAPYAIAKSGVLALTRSLAVALQAEPVTVNMVSPGVLENSVTHPPLKDVPKGRWGRPEDMLGAIAYLLSPEADYVTGQHLEVAGGWAL